MLGDISLSRFPFFHLYLKLRQGGKKIENSSKILINIIYINKQALSVDSSILAHPTGISVNTTGAKKCRLT